MTKTVNDALGRAVVLEGLPRRIVSLVPSQTELLADLGLDQEVVGLTRYCIHPRDWLGRKAVVGGTKKARFEKVEALAPDLILANKEENTQKDVERLEALAPVYVTDVHDLPQSLEMIRAVGALVGRSQAADAMAAEIQAGFEALTPLAQPVQTAYLIWRSPWMTIGADTFIHDMMARAGFHNVFGDQKRYPQFTLEGLAQKSPELVLLSSEPYPFAEPHLEEIAAAVPGARVRLVDGEPFSWYGSRILGSPGYLRGLQSWWSERA